MAGLEQRSRREQESPSFLASDALKRAYENKNGEEKMAKSWKDQLNETKNSGKSGRTFSQFERDDIYFFHLKGRYGRSYWNVPADNFYVALMEKTDAVIDEIERIQTDKQIAVDMAYLPNFAVETFVEAVRQKGWLPVYIMPDDRVYGVVFNDQFSKGARRAASAQL